MPDLTPITTPNAPAAAGHYAQAVVHNGVVHVSGQLGRTLDGKGTADQPFEVQARQAIANLMAVLAAAGSGPDRVIKATAFIEGIDNWGAFNRLWAEAMGEHRSARSVVPVTGLHDGYLVELEAVAAVRD